MVKDLEVPIIREEKECDTDSPLKTEEFRLKEIKSLKYHENPEHFTHKYSLSLLAHPKWKDLRIS